LQDILDVAVETVVIAISMCKKYVMTFIV